MKRGAENQLTKDGREDDDLEESSSGQGFKKASDTVLATRTIKALPGRAGKSGPPKPIFAGFGQPPTGGLFGSDTKSSTETSPPSHGSFNSFGTGFGASTPSAPTTSSFTFTSPAASTTPSGSGTFNSSPSTTNTSKAFASILSASANPFSPSTSTATASTSNGQSGPDLTSYYKNLRGLNTSFLTTISSTIEKDPFTDLSGLLESYKTLRLKVQKEQDEAPDKEGATTKMRETSNSKLAGASSIPASFSSFEKPSVSTTDSKPSTSSPFTSFPPKGMSAPSSSSTASGGSSLFSSNSAQPASTTTFTTTSSSPFSFGAPSKLSAPIEKPSGFSFGSTPSASDTLDSTTSSSSSNSSPFSFGASPTPSTSSPFGNASTNLFGSSSSSSLPFKIEPGKSAFGNATSHNSEKKPSTMPFGTPSQFSKNTGVFFGFGTTPTSTSTSASPTPATAATSESQETATTEGDETGSTVGGSESKEGTPGLLTPNPHDEEGAGEENEETTHAVKLKAYRMKKADEQGGSGWSELGMGVFRLKKHRETDSRRVLLRNSTNGKININFKIYSGLKPSVAKKALTFIGHADGVSQTYCVRLPNETQANELKAALDREIEFVKAKEP